MASVSKRWGNGSRGPAAVKVDFSDECLTGYAGLAFVARPVVAAHAQRLHKQLGYVPVFVDGSAIQVQGTQFEGARRGYDGSLQYWLHAVFVGDVWASSRLHPGATDVASSWHEQLKDDLAAMLPQGVCPWVRADNAYDRGDFVRWLQAQRWDYSISVTNDNNKAPVLRQVRGDSGHHWRRVSDDEHATLVWHQLSGLGQAPGLYGRVHPQRRCSSLD